MPLLPIKIPSGFFRNGTDLEGAGRWRDGSLVRWRDGSLRPVGGWRERKASAFSGIPRGMFAWQDNSGDRWVVAGSHNALNVMGAANITSNITPAGLTAGNVDATINTAYSGGFYGLGYYGQTVESSGIYTEATTWSLDNWGEYLVACNPQDGNLYEWQLSTGTPAATIANAPTDNLGLVVTEERFLFALVQGITRAKFNGAIKKIIPIGTPGTTNEAGDIILQTSGQIMAGVRTRGQTLIITDQDAHTATYQGPPFVYGFERVGTSCGLIARKAVAAVDAGVFWMGRNGFFYFDGSVVRELPCAVFDYVFGDINNVQISKSWAVSLGTENEIWWFYPSEASTEPDKYVAYDYGEDHWIIGTLSRTSGVDRGAFRFPFMCDTSANLYEHEVGFNYNGSDIFVESGPIMIGTGENMMHVNELIPDERTQGQVDISFKTRFYPNGTERTYGPYTMSNPTSVRFTGRQVRMRVNGSASDWRVGNIRFNAEAGGER